MSVGTATREAMGELRVELAQLSVASSPNAQTNAVGPTALLAERDVLAVVTFGGLATPIVATDIASPPVDVPLSDDARWVASGFSALDGRAHAEVWRVDGPVRTGALGALRYAANADYLFVQRRLDDDVDIAAATQAAYIQLLNECRALGFPHLLRVWNLLSEINQGEGDRERYRCFNDGRFAGFVAAGRLPTYPAATAIGRDDGPSMIYLLAARAPPQLIENPGQVSAFRYPREHGPTSPSFSRAALALCGGTLRLFVSGTASILGHRSCHVGDLVGQLDLTLQNLAAVAAAAGAPAPLFAPSAQAATPLQTPLRTLLRVYVRDAADSGQVAALLAERVPTDVPRVLVRADVCRRELLVEIEAVVSWPHAQT